MLQKAKLIKIKLQGIGLKQAILCLSNGDEGTLLIASKKSGFPSLRPHQHWSGTLGDYQEPLLCSPLIKSVDSHQDAAFGEDYRQKALCSKTRFSICTIKVTVLLSGKNKRHGVYRDAFYTEGKHTQTKQNKTPKPHLSILLLL